MRKAVNDAARPAGKSPIRPSQGRDLMASARASAAYGSVWEQLQAAIDGVMKDPSLTPEQRAAAVASLRIKQQVEAGEARRRVEQEEKQNEKSFRRSKRRLRGRGLPD